MKYVKWGVLLYNWQNVGTNYKICKMKGLILGFVEWGESVLKKKEEKKRGEWIFIIAQWESNLPKENECVDFEMSNEGILFWDFAKWGFKWRRLELASFWFSHRKVRRFIFFINQTSLVWSNFNPPPPLVFICVDLRVRN